MSLGRRMSSFLSCVTRHVYVVEDEWTCILFLDGTFIPALPLNSFGVKETLTWEVKKYLTNIRIKSPAVLILDFNYIHVMGNLNSDITFRKILHVA